MKMPQKGQRSVTLPEWVYEIAETYFKENEEELRLMDITSVTSLVRYWILQKSREELD